MKETYCLSSRRQTFPGTNPGGTRSIASAIAGVYYKMLISPEQEFVKSFKVTCAAVPLDSLQAMDSCSERYFPGSLHLLMRVTDICFSAGEVFDLLMTEVQEATQNRSNLLWRCFSNPLNF